MKLSKFNSGLPVLDVFNSRAFDRFFNDSFNQLNDYNQGSVATFSPAAEVEETEKSYLVRLSIPGVNKDEIKVEVTDDQLVISGERKKEKQEESKNYFKSEISYGKFIRSFRLNEKINKTDIDAVFENGMLTLTLLKAEPTQSKTISIK